MRVVNREVLLMNSLQQQKQRKLNLEFSGTKVQRDYSSEEYIASHLSESPTGQIRLMESILERNNMKRAVRRVIRNKGAPGVDGMTVHKVTGYLERHWGKIKKALLGLRDAPRAPVKTGKV